MSDDVPASVSDDELMVPPVHVKVPITVVGLPPVSVPPESVKAAIELAADTVSVPPETSRLVIALAADTVTLPPETFSVAIELIAEPALQACRR